MHVHSQWKRPVDEVCLARAVSGSERQSEGTGTSGDADKGASMADKSSCLKDAIFGHKLAYRVKNHNSTE